MSNLATALTLPEKEQGPHLLALANGGDPEAQLAYARIVFKGKYHGDADAAGSQAAAKNAAREAAEAHVLDAAQAGHLDAIREAADMYFFGRKEPGKFGSVIMQSQYAKSHQWYRTLLARPELNQAEQSLVSFRTGQTLHFVGNMAKDVDWEVVLPFWHRSLELGGRGALLAHACLGDYFYRVTQEFEKALPHLEATGKTIPSSAGSMAIMYQKGLGVDRDPQKSKVWWDLFYG